MRSRAPSFWRPLRWRSTGRAPMAQPPGVETRAWPKRARSGPSTRKEARIVFTSSYGASLHATAPGSTTTSCPSALCVTRAPRCSSTWIVVRTSASAGTFRTTERSRVSRVAKRSGSAAFLDPLTTTSPSSSAPPRITIVSIRPLPIARRARARCRRDRGPPRRGRSRSCPTPLGARPVLARCARSVQTPTRLAPRAPDPVGQLGTSRRRPPPPGAARRRPAPPPPPPRASRPARARAAPRPSGGRAPRARPAPPRAPHAARGRAPPARARRAPRRPRRAGSRPPGRRPRCERARGGRRRPAPRPAPAGRGSRVPRRAHRYRRRSPTPVRRAARARARPRSPRYRCRRRGRAAPRAPGGAPFPPPARSPAAGRGRGDPPRAGATRTRARRGCSGAARAPLGGRRARRSPGPPSRAAGAAPRRPGRRASCRARARAGPRRPRAAPARRPPPGERSPPRARRPASRTPPPRPSARRRQRLGLLAHDERVHDRVDVAVEHAVEGVEGQVDTVVGHPALREVVGADLLRAVARADHRLAVGGDLALLLAARALEEPGAQDLERLRLVLVLRLLVLAGDDEPGRQVRHAHGGVGRVDALPARARGAVHVDAEVLVGQLHLDILGLGQHRDGHRRGVDAPLRLGHRHALHAVHPALEFQAAEGALPLHERDHLLEAAGAGRARGQHLDAPAVPLGVARVHAEELGGEEARLVAAGAGPDLEHGVALVVGVLGKEEVLERRVECGQARLERWQLAARQLAQFGVSLAQDLAMLVEVARHALALAPADDRLLELGALLGELRELAPVGDDGRVRDQALQLLVAPLDLGEAVEHALTQHRGGSASPTPRIRRAGDPRPRQAGVEPEPLRLRPYLRWKRSTRPAVSTSFCLPVKNG